MNMFVTIGSAVSAIQGIPLHSSITLAPRTWKCLAWLRRWTTLTPALGQDSPTF